MASAAAPSMATRLIAVSMRVVPRSLFISSFMVVISRSVPLLRLRLGEIERLFHRGHLRLLGGAERLDDRRRDDDEQLAHPLLQVLAAEEVPEERDVSQDGDLRLGLEEVAVVQPGDGEGLAAPQ